MLYFPLVCFSFVVFFFFKQIYGLDWISVALTAWWWCVSECVCIVVTLTLIPQCYHTVMVCIPLLLRYQYIDLFFLDMYYARLYIYIKIIAHMQAKEYPTEEFSHRIVGCCWSASSFLVFVYFYYAGFVAAPFQLYQIQPFHRTFSWLLFIETTINQSMRRFLLSSHIFHIDRGFSRVLIQLNFRLFLYQNLI